LGRAFVIQSGVNRAASPPLIQTTTPKDVGGWLRFASQPRQKLGVLQGFIATVTHQRQNCHVPNKPKKIVGKKVERENFAIGSNGNNRKVSIGKNGQEYLERKNLQIEPHGWDFKDFSPKSSKVMPFTCSKGHKFEQRISHVADGIGCPICSNRRVVSGVNDIFTTHPNIAKEADGWDASAIAAGSTKKLQWKCSNGHTWKVSPHSRTSSETGCPFCSNNQAWAGFNDLKTLFPEIAAEAHGWDAAEYLPQSNKEKNWLCPNGHVYKNWIANRVKRGDGCPYCSHQSILTGFNDLATTYPELAKEAYNWDARKVVGGKKKLKWKCPEGHIYLATPQARLRHASDESITRLGTGCPYCVNQKLLTGFNDLRTRFPGLAKEADGWDASKYIYGSAKKMGWRCKEGHRWKATIDHRSKGGQGCPTCANKGFDPNESGYLYLLYHEIWQLHKVGISNSLNDRTREHESRGWETIEMKGPMDGLLAYEWEQSILKMLKRRGADLAREDIAGKFDGYTESWVADSFPVKSIKQLMRLVEEDE